MTQQGSGFHVLGSGFWVLRSTFGARGTELRPKNQNPERRTGTQNEEPGTRNPVLRYDWRPNASSLTGGNMSRLLTRTIPALLLLGAGLAWMQPRVAGQATGQLSTKDGEWPMYHADLKGSKYSQLDQINASNFSKMEVAWRFKTANLGPRPENKLEGTPIMVKGMVYATAGTRRSVVALNPRTGELKWIYNMDEGERATRWA